MTWKSAHECFSAMEVDIYLCKLTHHLVLIYEVFIKHHICSKYEKDKKKESIAKTTPYIKGNIYDVKKKHHISAKITQKHDIWCVLSSYNNKRKDKKIYGVKNMLHLWCKTAHY